MNWKRLLRPNEGSNQKDRKRGSYRRRRLARNRYKGMNRPHRIDLYDRNGFLNLNGNGRIFTFAVLVLFFSFWINPVLQESRNKSACINISTKVVKHFYPDGEEPLDGEDFATYSAYKDCTFGD